jgi:hypothetical protein
MGARLMRVHPMTVEEVPIAMLAQHPDNANNGDIDAIEQSIEVNGLYQPVMVQRSTGYVIAGNHRLVAAMRLGADSLPVIYLDVNDLEAKRIMVVDNRTARLGMDDEAQMAALLTDLFATDPGLAGTGYEYEDFDRLRSSLDETLSFPDYDDTLTPEPNTPAQKGGLRYAVTPMVEEDGTVEEFMVSRPDYKPMTEGDLHAIRKAFGQERLAETEVAAYNVPSWRGKR